MQAHRLLVAVVLCGALSSVALPQPAVAKDIPRWPTEQAERLNQLNPQILRIQGRLSAARLHTDRRTARTLAKKLKALQEERTQLLRAMGRLP